MRKTKITRYQEGIIHLKESRVEIKSLNSPCIEVTSVNLILGVTKIKVKVIMNQTNNLLQHFKMNQRNKVMPSLIRRRRILRVLLKYLNMILESSGRTIVGKILNSMRSRKLSHLINISKG